MWHAIIEKASGAAVSFCTDLPAQLPSVLEAVPIDHQPGAGERWDAATRAVVASPPPSNLLVDAFAAADTTEKKIDVIARRLGLK